MKRPIRRIALSTGGGDAPGLNAVIRGAVKSANTHGYDVVGFLKGYEGLVDPVSFIPVMNAYAWPTVMPVTSTIGLSATNTDRDSGRRRVPWHSTHGIDAKNCS